MSEDFKDRKVVSLSEQYPDKPLKKTTYRSNFPDPFIADDKSNSFDAEISKLDILRESFTVSSTESIPFTSINTAVQRGAALIAPYTLPQPEQYEGQHEINFQKLSRRLENAKLCNIEFGDLPQEVYTLIAMGSEFCQLHNTDKGDLTTGFPEIDKHLTQEEFLYLRDIKEAYDTGIVDDQASYAYAIIYHMYEDLLLIKELMLSGDINSPVVQQQGQMISNMVSQYIEPPTQDMIEYEICEIIRSIEMFKLRKPYNYDYEIYELMKEGGFEAEELGSSLTSLNITPSKENQEVILSILESLECFPISRTDTALEVYKNQSLAPLVKFVEYYPNADPEIVSYALFEAYFPYGKDNAETENQAALMEDVNSVIESIFDDKTIEKFMAWKTASTTDGNDWELFPDKKEQLQSLYACKDMVSLYESSKRISLRYYLNLVIYDDIQTAQFILKDISTDHLINRDIADEIINEAIYVKLNIEDAYTTPKLEFAPDDDPTPTDDNPNSSKPKLTIV